MIYKDEQDVKNSLSREIDGDVRDDIWNLLLDDRWVMEILQGTDGMDIGEMGSRYRRLAKLGKKRKKNTQAPRQIGPDERLYVLSSIMAKEASQNPDVTWFRKEILDDHLLDRDDVDKWIKRKAKADGPNTVYLRFPIPADRFQEKHTYGVPWADPELLNQETNPPMGWSQESLAYQASSTSRAVSRVLVAWDGVLGQLRTISVRLAKSFDWAEDQATAFILTGVTPALTKSRIHIDRVWGHGLMSRIQMEIDPTLSPRAVMEVYRKARSELGQTHHRSMSTKHLHMAEFYGGEKSQTWPVLMEDWNKSRPDWSYREVRNFSRDCRSAWQRVTGQERSDPLVRIDDHEISPRLLELAKFSSPLASSEEKNQLGPPEL